MKLLSEWANWIAQDRFLMVSVFQKNASSNEQCEGFLTITGEYRILINGVNDIHNENRRDSKINLNTTAHILTLMVSSIKLINPKTCKPHACATLL